MSSVRRVATIGECMIELRHTDAQTLKTGFGGDTLNTALYLARIGAARGIAVDYVTALGEDAYSDEMLAAWQAEGIGTSLVARLPGRLPGLYIIRTNAQGERSFTYFRSAAAAREMLRDGRDAKLTASLAGYACVYLSGITLSILDDGQRQAMLGLLERLRGGGTLVAFDANYRPVGWPSADVARQWMTEALRRADIALPTFDDEQRLFGDAQAKQSAERLHGLGVGEVVVKLGAEGSLVSTGKDAAASALVPSTRPAQVVDTTAAGDSFNAGYLAARLLGHDAEAAAGVGNRLAAAKIGHPGAIMPRAAMPDLGLS